MILLALGWCLCTLMCCAAVYFCSWAVEQFSLLAQAEAMAPEVGKTDRRLRCLLGLNVVRIRASQPRLVTAVPIRVVDVPREAQPPAIRTVDRYRRLMTSRRPAPSFHRNAHIGRPVRHQIRCQYAARYPGHSDRVREEGVCFLFPPSSE